MMVGIEQFMLFITSIGNTLTMVALSVALICWLWLKDEDRLARFFASVMIVGMALVSFLKIIVRRVRPEGGILEVTGFSFPSGHATVAAIFFGLLIYMFAEKIKNKVVKWSFIGVNLVLIILIAYSRVYFGVHWAVDVVFGVVFGLSWVVLSGFIARRYGLL
jgi:undecaprenyl-diphosphatase